MGTFLGLLIAFVVSCFIYKDAEERGMSGMGWAAGTLLLMIVTVPLYLVVRKPRIVK